MFRLVTFWCLIHLSVGNIIHGRILLDGDAHRTDPIPANARLTIQLEQISEEHIAATIPQEIEISASNAFPVEYQIAIPAGTFQTSSVKLSAQVKRGPIFLYAGEETVHVPTDSDRGITVDIPVRVVRGRKEIEPPLFHMESSSWPELVGREGTYAVQYIKEKSGLTNVLLVPEGSPITMDYQIHRVRVFIDKNGIVVHTPHTG